ncbi:MAG: HNH endonuclease [Rhodomicrobium sp.]
MSVCNHRSGRCYAPLTKGNTHFHHRHSDAAGGPDTLSNCVAMCIPCHKRTRTYGRN